MQRYFLFSFLLLISLCPTLHAQAPDTLWTKTYGYTDEELLFSIDQTADGGFIMSGSVGLFSDSSVYWLVRTDDAGDTLWTRTYGHPDTNNVCQSGQLTFDGGYIMAASGGGMWLIKTDDNGDTLWTRSTGGPGAPEPLHVVQTADSGYVVIGNKIMDLLSHVALFKINALGETEWIKTYSNGQDLYGISVQQTADSGYIIISADPGAGSGEQFIWLIKTDAGGDTTWTTTFEIGSGEGTKVMQTADSGYAIFGLINGTLAAPGPEAPHDWLLIKTDSSGTLDWSQTYGGDGSDQSMGMIIPSDGGFLLTGWLALSDTVVHLWLVRTDADGDTLWTTTVGDTGMKAGIGLVEIAEGEYAVVGLTSPTGDDPPFNAWLVRFGDPTAQSTTPAVARVPEAFALHANYPNPFNPSTTIGFDLPAAAVVTLTVYDILGREVRRLMNRQIGPGYHQAIWNGRTNDGREVPTGIYIARLVTPENTRSIKMVLLK